LKEGVKFFEFIDIRSNKQESYEYIFTRKLSPDKISIEIDGINNKVLYINEEQESLPILKSKPDLIYDERISVFDIECYLDKNNIYRPYACG